MDSEHIAAEAVKALDVKLAKDVRVFDVRGVSNVTDFYIVASGTSAPHLKALATATLKHLRDNGVPSYRTSGEPGSGWVIVDYIHVVVHLFSPEARAYYNVERLWEGKTITSA